MHTDGIFYKIKKMSTMYLNDFRHKLRNFFKNKMKLCDFVDKKDFIRVDFVKFGV